MQTKEEEEERELKAIVKVKIMHTLISSITFLFKTVKEASSSVFTSMYNGSVLSRPDSNGEEFTRPRIHRKNSTRA